MKLVLLGGSRNSGDEARVKGLQRLAQDLGIEVGPLQLNSQPPFLIVASSGTCRIMFNLLSMRPIQKCSPGSLERVLGSAPWLMSISESTLLNSWLVSCLCVARPPFYEFGYIQAAGVIPVAHASGGPLKDIIVQFEGEPTGTDYFKPSLLL